LPALIVVLSCEPKWKQRRTQTKSPLGVLRPECPIQRCTEIVVFNVASLEPFLAFNCSELSPAFFGQHQTISCMSATAQNFFRTGCEPRRSILANRFEHCESRLPVRHLRLLNQTLARKRFHSIQDIESEIIARVAGRLYTFQRASVDKHRQTTEEFL